jgi:RHS repeat-associated protein
LQYQYGELSANSVDVDENKNTGNIAKQTVSFNGLTNPLVQTYKYDSLYRLTEARETTNNNQTWKEAFNYDRYGNRLGHDKFVGTTQLTLDNKTHPTIDANTNRFNPNQGYVYDKNGNLTDDAEGRTFIFNGDNKQRYVVQSGKNIGEYFYDGEGKRVKKKVYELDGINVKEETVFVYSAGKLVAEYSTKQPPLNPTTSYTVTDQLLSPRVITDSNGQVISRRDFMPFGEEIVNNIGERAAASLKYNVADSVRQKFTGYLKDDETQLDFAEARMYENRHGRFTAVDPLLASGKSANPQTFNRYVYCLNNPLIFIDSDGLQTGQWITRQGDDGKDYLHWSRTLTLGTGESVIRERNKAGDLIARVPNDPNQVLRLNEMGPLELKPGMVLGQIPPFKLNGYEYIYSDSFLESIGNDPHPGLEDALNPVEAALFLTGGGGSLKSTEVVGKGALESAISGEGSAFIRGGLFGGELHTSITVKSTIDKEGTQILRRSVEGLTEDQGVVEQVQGVGKVFNTKEIPLPNAQRAIQYQRQLLANPVRGAYKPFTNSCITHVCDVLKAGGLSSGKAYYESRLLYTKSFLGQLKWW